MSYVCSYEGTKFFNPGNKYSIIKVRTADQTVPKEMRLPGRARNQMIHFVAVGYDLPRTDAVEMELEGEWVQSKYGYQLQVAQWREIVPQTTAGIQSYLGSGLIKGVGPKLAASIVERFGMDTMDVLENHPERLLEIRGISEEKLEAIKVTYRESRAMRDIMSLLGPFKITPKTAMAIYEYFGPACVDILQKNPYELCQISGFAFKRVDAIVRKTDNRLHDAGRIKGALHFALDDARSRSKHLFLPQEELLKTALRLLNETIPVPELRLHKQEVETVLQQMILNGMVVAHKGSLYLPKVFSQEDTVARVIAQRLVRLPDPVKIESALQKVNGELGITLSEKQEQAVHMAFRYDFSIITGSPGTGKTTVLKTIIEVYRLLYPDGKLALMAPTGRASRRMAESTGVNEACTLHSALRLVGEEESQAAKNRQLLDGDLVIVDETSMLDMWLADQFFSRLKPTAKVILVGDPDQLPSVGAGNVLHELINSAVVPVTRLEHIFRQMKDSLIAYNAKFINAGSTKLYYGNDFVFIPSTGQVDVAQRVIQQYCEEVAEHGVEHVQILSPFRVEGMAATTALNENVRALLNPYRSDTEEIKIGTKHFRVGDRIMQTKNTDKVSNGDLGFIRELCTGPDGKQTVILEFGSLRLQYGAEEMANVELAYAVTVHKAIGSESDVIIMPLVKAHMILLYRNLLYTAVTRAKKRVVLVGEKAALFMAIHRCDNSRRNTMLGERIGMYYKALAHGTAREPSREERKNAG